MASRKFKVTSNALASVWGHTGASGMGSASQRDAAHAGIKIDLPLTPAEIEAQQIADELAAEHAAAEKAADPRSAFEKRYDIHDGIAHISSDTFCGLLVDNAKMRNLCDRVSKIIITDGFGFSAEYIPLDNKAAREKTTGAHDSIVAQTILQIGIVPALGQRDSAYLRSSHGKNRGLIRLLTATDEIKAHAASLADPDSTSLTHHAYASSLNPYGSSYTGNFARLFGNLATLRAALQDNVPVTLTVDTAVSGKVHQAMSLGILHPADTLPEPPQNLKDVMFTDFKRLVWGFEPTRQSLLIKHIFGENAGFRIFTHNTTRPPVAILMRPYAPFVT